MDRDTAISKIKKCLALGRSTNPTEAAVAMRQAQKLMEQFGLDDEAVAMSDVGEASTPVRAAALPVWEVSLARHVAEAFGCEMFVQRGYRLALDPRRQRSDFQFIGVGPAPQVAAYAMEVLGRQCAKARMAHIAAQPRTCKPITKTARGDAFARAWVVAAVDVLHAFNGTEHNRLLLESYIAKHYPDLKSFKPKRRDVGRNVKDSSYTDGHAAGRKAQLNRGVGGVPDQKRVGHG